LPGSEVRGVKCGAFQQPGLSKFLGNERRAQGFPRERKFWQFGQLGATRPTGLADLCNLRNKKRHKKRIAVVAFGCCERKGENRRKSCVRRLLQCGGKAAEACRFWTCQRQPARTHTYVWPGVCLVVEEAAILAAPCCVVGFLRQDT